MVDTIVLAGNPNVGKSSLYNALTRTWQHVGNWPGKTVEKKEGKTWIDDQEYNVVDLPGIYSLTAYSMEEIITRDFIVDEQPRLVVAVVDASNLERNLYLVTQLIELEVPLLLALNMADVAHQHHIGIDRQRLSEQLGGIPIVETVGNRRVGIDGLKQAIRSACEQFPAGQPPISYSPEVENEIGALAGMVEDRKPLGGHYPARWMAIKLLESDEDIIDRLKDDGHAVLLEAAQQSISRIAEATKEDPETLIADSRYSFIGDVACQSVERDSECRETPSDRIDQVVTHPIFGTVIFFALMWLVFQFTTNVSAPFVDWIDGVIGGPVTHWVTAILGWIGLTGTWVESLFVDGIIAGVGGVLVFVPVLLTLFFVLAILEDSGYMARAAFVMEHIMKLIGLPGKAFLPLIVGFGCTVPAIYASRTLDNEDDRKLVSFLTTFISCGARLPIYVLFGIAFFGAQSGLLVFGMYGLGIAIALLTGFALKKLFFSDKEPTPFVIELPPYRAPTLRDVLRQMWQRTEEFLRKASTVILAFSVVLWLMLSIPVGSGSFNNVATGDSLFGTISRTIAPAFEPAGFGTWQASGSLLSGFVAKEIIIVTMNQIYLEEDSAQLLEDDSIEPTPTFAQDLEEIVTSFVMAVVKAVEEIANIVPRTVSLLPGINLRDVSLIPAETDASDTSTLQAILRTHFTPLTAVAFSVFVLLYIPCITSISAMRHEFGTRWMLYQIAYTSIIAWAAAVAVNQAGRLLGWG
ncbi:MAG: ferrous iron transport protein B [Anaerolineae bacterium]|nr:ferrous iron transport protein B [Anaerolineae bacterium]